MGRVYKGQLRWKSSIVDWKAYTEGVINSVKHKQILKELSEEFKKIITDAAKIHVGKTKLGKWKVSWVTPAVRDTLNI